MTLPDVPELALLVSSLPPLLAAPLSVGVGTRPADHPPRFLI
jgi:hypothetical protein